MTDNYIDETNINVCGVDEAGRGPWAGPVFAAAVIIDHNKIPTTLLNELTDSKKISAQKRKKLFEQLKMQNNIGIYFSIAHSTVKEIEDYNILQSTLLAMKRAINNLFPIPKICLIDGVHLPNITIPSTPIIKGDLKFKCISAASILAKVSRDEWMKEKSLEFPDYLWEKNSGYGTKQHHDALKQYGVTPYHRKTFKPIAKLLNQNN